MTQTAFPFVDPHQDFGVATVEPEGDVVVVDVSLAGMDQVAMHFSRPVAIEFAHAILAAAEQNFQRSLPQSRQIGGIIGPY